MDLLATVQKGDSLLIPVSFENDAGEAAVPSSARWSLADTSGAIINEREDVALTPAETMYVELSGDDLPWAGSQPGQLYELRFVAEGTVTSSYTGNPQAKRKEVRIMVEDTANDCET